MACAPGVTLAAISSRWSCMASLLQAGSTSAAPVPRAFERAHRKTVDEFALAIDEARSGNSLRDQRRLAVQECVRHHRLVLRPHPSPIRRRPLSRRCSRSSRDRLAAENERAVFEVSKRGSPFACETDRSRAPARDLFNPHSRTGRNACYDNNL
jgi:hypothetical protein